MITLVKYLSTIIILILMGTSTQIQHSFTFGKSSGSHSPATEPSDFIKSIRVDLSSIETPANFTPDDLVEQIVVRAGQVHANTLFVNPWSDGWANYASDIADRNVFGSHNFFENLIARSHQKHVAVFAWFVVGKDNFPSLTYPEWYAKTRTGQPYRHVDEPGIELPVASLANRDYDDYHLRLVGEVNQLDVDGWVISEPLMGWGDRYDADYIDFSDPMVTKFKDKTGLDPRELFMEKSFNYIENQPDLYRQWADFRSDVVSEHVERTMDVIRQKLDRKVVITLFTEPDSAGKLKSLDELKDWLGTDVKRLIALKPDFLEIQDLFLDFEHPQPPDWVKDMVEQFQEQIKDNPLPVLVSIQGFDSVNRALSTEAFKQAIESALKSSAQGTSFYAYHTLDEEKWQALEGAWHNKYP